MSSIDDTAVGLRGLDSRIAFGEQADYVTRATPDRSFEFLNESITADYQRLESQALRSSQFNPRWAEGSIAVDGDVSFELANQGFGLLLEHAFGNVSTEELVVGEAFRHTFTPGDKNTMAGRNLTGQIVRGGDQGVPFDYVGLKVAQLQISCDVDQIAQVQVTFAGREELVDQHPAHTLAIPDNLVLMTFVHGALSIAGSEIAVNSASATLENNLATDRRRLGSKLRRNMMQNGFRTMSGNFNADFQSDVALYNRYVSGEESQLELVFDAGPIGTTGENFQLRLVGNVRYNGETPTVGGPEEIRQNIEWQSVPTDADGDAGAITCEYVTSDDTP